MKILSIEKSYHIDRIELWIEVVVDKKKIYKCLQILGDNTIAVYIEVPASIYNRLHDWYVGLVGEFNPYNIYLPKPVNLPDEDFNYESVLKIYYDFEKEHHTGSGQRTTPA
jgi:hypothetical protein